MAWWSPRPIIGTFAELSGAAYGRKRTALIGLFPIGRFLPQLLPGLFPRSRRFFRAPHMTKADRIRATAKKHPRWSTARIGEACDCSPEYVRVALRQRVNGCASRADINLKNRLLQEHGVGSCSHLRYLQDPEYRRRKLADHAQRWRNDEEFRERRKRQNREWYRAQREASHA
jgi:hypothetical protein